MKIIKFIDTNFEMSYPAMSVYEFEHFKEEKEVLEYWKSSSIYIICQRPVLYFDEVFINAGIISMKIKQRGDNKELSVTFIPSEDPIVSDMGKEFWIDVEFYDSQQTIQPFRNVAGIKILNNKKEFIVWLTPERLLFFYIKRHSEVMIEGEIHEFLYYTVHYIGQAYNQAIWKRLTGHEKLSKVLAIEHPFISGEFSPYELTLIFLRFAGRKEGTMLVPENSVKIEDAAGNELTDEGIVDAFSPRSLNDIKEYAINDFEAYFINFFLPKYNKTVYKNYPNISSGLKSLGYDLIRHKYMLFAGLRTEEATYSIEISPIYSE